MVRPFRNRKDIQLEKQRLAEHQKALEDAIAGTWSGLRNSVKPVNLIKGIVEKILRKYTH